ncbi:MAG: hypothetical protein Q4D61_06530, partial [Cardiobacteriaceae bacterium]|nr:hypothetical protein [Cardiobacteriaceae bacterium]
RIPPPDPKNSNPPLLNKRQSTPPPTGKSRQNPPSRQKNLPFFHYHFREKFSHQKRFIMVKNHHKSAKT